MKHFSRSLYVFLASFLLCSLLSAQQAAISTSEAPVVPRLVNFSGKAMDAQGKTITGMAGITFSIYSQESGGSPLWMETQNVQLDPKGNYTAQLGATKTDGLPLDVFASGEARWLGVRINGGEEQPRVLLLSVPYALKAADAQTLGGLPASAFQLAGAANIVAAQSNGATSSTSATPTPSGSITVTTAGGTANKLAKFDGTSDITNSQIFDNGTNVGIGNTAPASKLDVSGGATIRGLLSLPANGAATAAGGKTSQPFSFTASAYNSGTGSAVNQNFRWQAEPTGNNTTTASGTLNLLHSVGANAPAETGLKIAGNGHITFAPGQSFAGLTGVVSNVGFSAPSSDFTVTGSPVTGNGTLALKWTTPPTSADVPNSIVKRDANGYINVTEVNAETSISGLIAVLGFSDSNSGVYGGSNSAAGVYGAGTTGVYGLGTSGYGVFGTVGSSGVDGLHGESTSGNSGVAGLNFNSTSGYGVYGQAESASGYGVFGLNTANGGVGVWGGSTGGPGVYATSNGGWAVDAYGTGGATGILAGSDTGYAGWFNGDVEVEGNLSKSGGSFKIDSPLDPANKYLYHSFVESPDMMNVYNGNVTTDGNGEAVVQLPAWFEALNRDFRYQLTAIGTFAQAMVESEVANHQFTIKTDKPGVKVSWQVTGIRQDAWANAHRIPVEVTKPESERGLYLHPELFGAPPDKSIAAAHHPIIPQAPKPRQAAALKTATR